MRSFSETRFFNRAQLVAGVLVIFGALPAMAGTYQLIDRFDSAAGLGETALYLDQGSVLPVADGRKVADLVSVNSYNRQVSVFSVQVECSQHAWRVMQVTDYEIDRMIAPHLRAAPEPPAFAQQDAATASGKAVTMMCGGAASAAPAAGIQADDAIDLSKRVAPGLKRPADDDDVISR
jgi:hypothetical protein